MQDSSWITCRFFFFLLLTSGNRRSCVSPTGPLAYDRSLISDKVAATLVKPVIGEASPPHTLPEFSLISFDKSGNREPLPPGLGNLPLYLEDEGYFSVNGALDFTLFSPHTALAPVSYDIQPTIHPMINNIPHFSCESQHIAPDRHPYYLNDDTISWYATPPSSHTAYCGSPPNGFVVSHQWVLREGVTSAMCLIAPGEHLSRPSKP